MTRGVYCALISGMNRTRAACVLVLCASVAVATIGAVASARTTATAVPLQDIQSRPGQVVRPATGLILERHRGVDSCQNYSTATMASFYSATPYGVYGIYIGGAIGSGCGASAYTSSWVTTVLGQGWNLEPIWDDLQPNCSSTSHPIPTSSSAAYTAGYNSGYNAVSTAYSKAISGPIILDIDYYEDACAATTDSYVSGWVNALHAYGYQAGIYSYGTNLNHYASIANVPDEVIGVYITSTVGVYNGLANSGLNPILIT